MIAYLFFLILGFPIIIKSADWLVEGSTTFAKKFGISDLVLGLTLISFGTSLPELIISFFSSLRGESELLTANIIGSNLANILLILGLSGMIYPITVKYETVWKEIPLNLMASLIALVLGLDIILNQVENNEISRGDGLILIIFFFVFIYYVFSLLKNKEKNTKHDLNIEKINIPEAILKIILGLVGLFIGGQLIVDNAVNLSLLFGVSQSLVGITIVAIGTSLPEIATSVSASLKKKTDLIVGNVMGSNIFNLLMVLGLNAMVSPIGVHSDFAFDITIVITASFLLFVFMFIGKKQIIEKYQASMLLSLYIFYIIYTIFRG